MDFFTSQDKARRNTWILVGYYALAIVAIVVSIYFAALLAFTSFGKELEEHHLHIARSGAWNPELFWPIAGITLFIVVCGSLFKIIQLSGGGRKVAEMLGGVQLHPDTQDPVERKVLNVVEEMAIAAGTPVPPVYLMPNENAINAFAAGYKPADAVVGVTRGCIEKLSRDELQGVIAHEFSHILNGDMRLNIRLIGVLNGILIIGITGYYIVRSTMFSGRRRSSSNRDSGIGPILVFGFALFVIGYVGVFFANLIKSAVSRQREFLADASAVQFTRNADGIAGALKKIGGYSSGSKLASASAGEVSHMFFANGLTSAFLGLLATHPPLDKRIKRIDPGFDGEFTAIPAASARAEASSPLTSGFSAGGGDVQVTPEKVSASIGAPNPAHLAFAQQVLASIPEPLKQAAHEPYGARALIYAFLLSADKEERDRQLSELARNADDAVFNETLKLVPHVETLDDRLRLPLVDVAIPALSELTKDQARAFEGNVRLLVRFDRKISLFEYALERTLMRNLALRQMGRTFLEDRFSSLEQVEAEVISLLSVLAYAGHSDVAAAEEAFRSSMARIWQSSGMSLLPREQSSLKAIDSALDTLVLLKPMPKKQLIEAAVRCISHDGKITLAEAELLRAIGDSLDCPVPPILADG